MAGCAENKYSIEELGIEEVEEMIDTPDCTEYEDEQRRFDSFQRSEITEENVKNNFVKAGLYYVGEDNGEGQKVFMCKCYFCGAKFIHWQENADPSVEHARVMPNCPFINKSKGNEFVKVVRAFKKSNLEDSVLTLEEVEQRVQSEKQKKLDETINGCTYLNIVTNMNQEQKLSLDDIKRLCNEGVKLAAISAKDIAFGVHNVQEGTSNSDNEDDVTLDQDQLQAHGGTQNLETENRRLRKATFCIECQNNKREIIFLPCQDLFLCETCFNNLQDKKECGKCQKTVKAIKKVRLDNNLPNPQLVHQLP